MNDVEVDYPDDAPDLLFVMRLVSIGQGPPTPFGRGLTDWMKSKPIAYMEKFAEVERTYWAAKKPSAGDPVNYSGTGPCPTCGRSPEVKVTSEAALAACRDWLEKNK